jgi:hypothetical protein
VLASYDITRDVDRPPRLRQRATRRQRPQSSLTELHRREQEAQRVAQLLPPALDQPGAAAAAAAPAAAAAAASASAPAAAQEARALPERVSVSEQHLLAGAVEVGLAVLAVLRSARQLPRCRADSRRLC